MKFAFCGYDFFADCMQDLIADGHVCTGLFSYNADNQYDFNVRTFAMAESQKARVTTTPICTEDLAYLHDQNTDILICAAYPYKVPVWQGFLKYAINIHPSPLPEGRGAWPLPWLILKQYKQSAISIHEVSQCWDAGDILAQHFFDLSPTETYETICAKSQMVARPLLRETINNIETKWANKRPQKEGSYWPRPQKEDRTVTCDMTIAEIDRIVRAFSKFEPYFFIDGQKHYLRQVGLWQETHNFSPGTIVHHMSKEPVYAVKDGFMVLTHYQKAEDE